MTELHTILLYLTIFISLFFEVFLLITYLEVRHDIKKENDLIIKGPSRFPTTTVIVPCFNEEKTVEATINSLLNLDYPKEKLKLILINDGSTDQTLSVLNKFSNNPQIQILSKENGGKHTAVNLGISLANSELISCLDADSFVNKDTLKNIIPYFDDETVMAVTPSIKVHEPQNILQKMQKNEYRWGIFLRRMLSSIGALYVTPGPFSVFRSKVFRELGNFKNAHLTEDMEMALRLQKHRYKIVNSHNAHVYTVAPKKLSALIKQRVRWTYGFMNNIVDYRELVFNRKYGHIGLFIIPLAIFSIFYTPFLAGNLLAKTTTDILKLADRVMTVGINWDFSIPSFDWYFINTGAIALLSIIALLLTLTIIYLSIKLSDGKFKLDRSVFYYLAIYYMIIPIWLTKAIFDTIFRRKVTWR